MIKDYTNTQVDPRREQISEAFVNIIKDIDRRLDVLERMMKKLRKPGK